MEDYCDSFYGEIILVEDLIQDVIVEYYISDDECEFIEVIVKFDYVGWIV